MQVQRSTSCSRKRKQQRDEMGMVGSGKTRRGGTSAREDGRRARDNDGRGRDARVRSTRSGINVEGRGEAGRVAWMLSGTREGRQWQDRTRGQARHVLSARTCTGRRRKYPPCLVRRGTGDKGAVSARARAVVAGGDGGGKLLSVTWEKSDGRRTPNDSGCTNRSHPAVALVHQSGPGECAATNGRPRSVRITRTYT